MNKTEPNLVARQDAGPLHEWSLVEGGVTIETDPLLVPPKLKVWLDPQEIRQALEQAVAAEPELADELLAVFPDDDSAGEPGALFNYLFVLADRKADGADYPVVGYRLRNADERLLARRALKASERVE